jgi:hypothetical protein
MSQRLLDRSRQLRLPQPELQRRPELLQLPVERPPLVRRPVLGLPAVMPPAVLALPVALAPEVDLPVDRQEALVALPEATAIVPVATVATVDLFLTLRLSMKSMSSCVGALETDGEYGVGDSGLGLTDLR